MRCSHLLVLSLVWLLVVPATGQVREDWRVRMLQFGARAQRDAQPRERNQGQPLSEEEIARHVLHRMAFGPRPGQVEAVRQMGWRAWAKGQLEPESIDDSAVEAVIAEKHPSLRLTMGQAFETYRPPYANDPPTVEDQQERNRLRGQIMRELRESVLHRAVNSERQFQEVMVEFWRNHFNIDQNKDDTAYLTNHWEENVLRRFAFGKFEDLLLATARHPAMLIYLDNIVSQKPLTEREEKLLARYEGRRNTPRSVDALARHRGLNENYARELMELHSLGVDNGYDQRDVIELSRVLTGWSAGWHDDGDYGFRFRAEVHDDGPKRLLGTSLRGNRGEDDGVRVIRGLAHHPKTAEFIAFKLCRYLVRDDPNDDLVRRIAKVFRDTDGDLRKVYQAIIFSDDFLYRQNHAVKFKTPFEFVVSSLRATDAQVENWHGVQDALRQMGQPVYACVDPTGYYDQAEAWLDPGVLVYRWTYALRLAMGQVPGVTVPDDYVRRLELLSPEEQADTLMRDYASRSTSTEHDAILRDAIMDSGVRHGLGLAIGGPAFQQQ